MNASLTGKLEIILIVNAVVIPQSRNMKFDREYFIPHVGLFRISSALEVKFFVQSIEFHSLTFDDIEYRW